MKTAEEILQQECDKVDDMSFAIFEKSEFGLYPIMKAMEEYAKQEVIAALKFYRNDNLGNAIFNRQTTFKDGTLASDEQLYELYLKSKQ